MSERLQFKATENNQLTLKIPNYEVEISFSETPYSPFLGEPTPIKIPEFEKSIIQASLERYGIVSLYLTNQNGLMLYPDGGINSEGRIVCYPSTYQLTRVYTYQATGQGVFVIVKIHYTNPEVQQNIHPLHG